MLTANQVLASVPKSYRYSRYALTRGWDQLKSLADKSESMDVRLLAQGILYADQSCRTTGAVSIALRNCSPWQAAKAIATMHGEGITVMNRVPAWLNQHGVSYLQV